MIQTWLRNQFLTTRRSALTDFMISLHPRKTGKPLCRIGPQYDGGYLIPEDLDGVIACFSPGVSTETGFDFQMAEMGIDVYQADRTVTGPATAHPRFHFLQKHVGPSTGNSVISVSDWIRESIQMKNGDLVMQMDIEGAEWDTLWAMPQRLLERFRIIVVEFHQLDLLWSNRFFRRASRTIRHLLHSHTCVHLHPNNCCGLLERDGLSIPRVLEVTFLRNDRFSIDEFEMQFPNSLDFDCTHKASIDLPQCWYHRELL